MNKLMILLVSVSALSLAACGDDQTAQTNKTANQTTATTDASKPATTPDPAKPADTKMASGDATKPADTAPATDATKPATTPAAPMMALDPKIQTMIDGLKAKAATMSADEKTKSVADIKTAAEGMAKTSGKSDADVKSVGAAAETAAKAALGM